MFSALNHWSVTWSNKRNFTASISPLSCAVGNFLKRAEKCSATTEKYLRTQSSARAKMCVFLYACKSAKDALFSIDCTKIAVQMLIKHARIDWPPWVDVGINVSWVCFQPDLWYQTSRGINDMLKVEIPTSLMCLLIQNWNIFHSYAHQIDF